MPPRGPFVPIPNTIKLAWVGHSVITAKPVVMTTHIVGTAAPTIAQFNAINTALQARIVTELPLLSNDWIIDFLQLTDLNSATGPQATYPVTAAGTGGSVAASLSAVTHLRTALRGRSFVGRHYLPVGDGNVDAEAMKVISASNINTFWTRFDADLAALSPASGFVVVSRKLRLSTRVTSFDTRDQLGRVRRRQFG